MKNKTLDLMMGQIEAWASAVSGRRPPAAQFQKVRTHCSGCKGRLPPPHTPGSRYCILCSPAKIHRVYMSFTKRGDTWHCTYREWDRTPLPRQLSFRDSAKIYEMSNRGHALINDVTRQALDRAIEIGHGAIWLYLTVDQYLALKVLHAKK